MNERRLSLSWFGSIRSFNILGSQVFTLLDAAAYVITAQVDLCDPDNASDFIALSFYKIFGFPDLGALIVRKASGYVLSERRYFDDEIVDMIINGTDIGTNTDTWHAKKLTSLHEMLEDGTPAFYSILALSMALKAHQRLFDSMENVLKYTCNLITILYQKMSTLSHINDLPLCKIYEGSPFKYGTNRDQGLTIVFNVRNSSEEWIDKSDFERLVILNGIQLRIEGVCNPGDIAWALQMSSKEMRDNFDEGLRCGNELDKINGKSTGVIRVSLGAMSSVNDIEDFMAFMLLFVDITPEETSSDIVLDFKATLAVKVRVEESTVGFACPVAACMASFKTREMLWSHFPLHKLGKAGTKSTSKIRACLNMRQWPR